ncbi:MAG: hypothetical protein ACJAQ4_001986 [Cryomorphaceae bacterium]
MSWAKRNGFVPPTALAVSSVIELYLHLMENLPLLDGPRLMSRMIYWWSNVMMMETWSGPRQSMGRFTIDGCENSAYTIMDMQGKMIEKGIYRGKPISVSNWKKEFTLFKPLNAAREKSW